jgi:serine/threonine protein kinase/CheY-like chemotaxis protein
MRITDPMETPKPNEESIPKQIDRYELHERIGSGGMGTIFKGIDTRLKRPVAIKVISERVKDPSIKQNIRERFLNEARAAGGLSHPNLVQIFDFNEKNGLAYIVMEFIEGETLDELIKSKGPLNNEELLRIGREVASALAFAHKRGIVHRDIKPSNIMIEAASGISKVLDFGIAKFVNEEEMKLTSTGMVLGSTHYLSPEHITGKNLDGRSDLFCLGTLLYEAATGIIPFRGENSSSILYKIVHQEPQDPTALRRNLHPGISRIILKALKKNQSERYQKGEDLEKDLTEVYRLVIGDSRVSGTVQAPVVATKSLFVRDSQLLTALQSQRKITQSQALQLRGTAVMDVLLHEGIVSEDEISKIVSEALSLPWIPRTRLKSLRLQESAFGLLPTDILEKHNMLPFYVDTAQKTVSVIIDGSSDFQKEAAIAELLENYQLKFYVGGRLSIQRLVASAKAGNHRPDEEFGPWDSKEGMGVDRHRVLVLDSRPHFQESMTRLFKGADNSLSVCNQFHEAFSKIQRDRFDLILAQRSLVGDELQFEQTIFKQNPETEIRLYDELPRELFAESISYRKFKEFFDRSIQNHMASRSEKSRLAATRLSLLGRKLGKEFTEGLKQLDEVYYATLLWALDVREGAGFEGLKGFDGIYHFRSIVESLQERYDGRGPRGLKGIQIPLATRVISALQLLEPFIDKKLTASDATELSNKYISYAGKQLDPRITASVCDFLRATNEKVNHGGRVVIVDSDSDYAQELSSKLRQMAHETTIYPDGLSALTGIKKDRPDLIISEVMLSQLDGFSLVARLRSDESLAAIPIIFLSESSAPEHSTKALQLGADDFLSKSQQSEFILTKLDKMLKRSRT